MARTKRDHGQYALDEGLVETREPGFDRPVFRRPGFNGTLPFGRVEKTLSMQTRKNREMRGLTREQLASMLGLSTQVFRRYEVAASKLHVTRLVHLCEILDVSPVAIIAQAAPHLFGETAEEARMRAEALSAIEELPENLLSLLLPLLREMRARK
mgnify:FL=1